MFVILVIISVVIIWCVIYVLQQGKPNITVPQNRGGIEDSINLSDIDLLAPKLTESYLTLDKYIGQSNVVEYLKHHINKAKEDCKPLPHIVLWGNGGLGKSSLMKATAQEMGGRFIEIVPANLKNVAELFNLLFAKQCPVCNELSPFSTTKCLICKQPVSVSFTPICQMQQNDIVFLEECHGLKADIEEAMYSLMQDGYMVVRYNGVDRRVTFPNITIAGATTQLGQLNKPFRDRFKIQLQLEPYSVFDIAQIISMYVEHEGLKIDEGALKFISKISHGVPRIAKKYVIDAATMGSNITLQNIKHVTQLLGVDSNGLDRTHIAGMKYILQRMLSAKNGGAGSSAIASSIGIPKAVWEELHEPALLYQGMIFMGSKGRRLTENAIDIYFPNQKAEIKN